MLIIRCSRVIIDLQEKNNFFSFYGREELEILMIIIGIKIMYNPTNLDQAICDTVIWRIKEYRINLTSRNSGLFFESSMIKTTTKKHEKKYWYEQ